MLKFRTAAGRAARRPPNYLGHKFQRPIWIVLLILAVIIWIARGGDPAKWAKFFGGGKDSVGQAGPADNAIEKPEPLALAPGEIRAAGPDVHQPVAAKRLFGGVKPELFTALEDDSVYRRQEEESFFTLLRTLDEADEKDIEIASQGVRTFRQLYDQPKEYRGEIVTVAGLVHRILPQKANLNQHGIEKFYEVWIEPEGTRVPIVFVCLELPPDYPVKDVMQNVTASGFFYKRLGYEGENDPKTGAPMFRSSPLVLAKTLQWTPKSKPQDLAVAGDAAAEHLPGLPPGIPTKWVLPILGLGMALMIFLAVYSYRLSRSSVLDRGPIVGRARRAAAESQEPTNLNQLKIDP